MANFVEKRLPQDMRNNLRTLIAAALGLFLGLRYNSYLNDVLAAYVPDSSSLLYRGVILAIVTVTIVYVSIWLQKALDGK